VREVKVVIFLEKARNLFVGKVWLPITSDVSFFNGKLEIKRRLLSTSMLLQMSRDVRCVNLLRRRLRKGRFLSRTESDNLRRLVMERKCLETRERDFKHWSSMMTLLSMMKLLIMNLKIHSQHSSGKYKYCCEEDLREVLFLLFIGSFGDGLGF